MLIIRKQADMESKRMLAWISYSSFLRHYKGKIKKDPGNFYLTIKLLERELSLMKIERSLYEEPWKLIY